MDVTIYPILGELVIGPVGVGFVMWILLVVWLGIAQHRLALASVLLGTTVLLGIAAGICFDASTRHSPIRDGQFLASLLCAGFGMSALICGTISAAIGIPAVRERARRVQSSLGTSAFGNPDHTSS